MSDKLTQFLIESELITQKAKLIFGFTIVNKAYYSYMSTNTASYMQILINSADEQEMIPEHSTSIGFEITDIVIEFNNGKSVTFTASEWGSMSSTSSDVRYVSIDEN